MDKQTEEERTEEGNMDKQTEEERTEEGNMEQQTEKKKKKDRDLLGGQRLSIVLQEVSAEDGAHDGQALARLQLGSKRQQPRGFHMGVLIQLQQHQQLRSDRETETETERERE